jgi:DNA polymerase delta subunit 1
MKTCAEIPGTQVLTFKSEAIMLTAWRDFMLDLDPDILTGYNICNFDLNYLIERARALKIPNFSNFGRLQNRLSEVKNIHPIYSKGSGYMREFKEINIEGRIQFDMMQYFLR